MKFLSASLVTQIIAYLVLVVTFGTAFTFYHPDLQPYRVWGGYLSLALQVAAFCLGMAAGKITGWQPKLLFALGLLMLAMGALSKLVYFTDLLDTPLLALILTIFCPLLAIVNTIGVRQKLSKPEK